MNRQSARWLVFSAFLLSVIVSITAGVAERSAEERQVLSHEAQLDSVVLMVVDVVSGNATNASAERFVADYLDARRFNDADTETLGILHEVSLGLSAVLTVAQFKLIRAENRWEKQPGQSKR